MREVELRRAEVVATVTAPAGPGMELTRQLPWRLRHLSPVLAAVLLLLLSGVMLPLAWTSKPPMRPPGPLAIRQRTTRLRDVETGMPRAPPAEVDVALDYFQRTFPEITTEEHLLIRRWEELADVFGGADAANELVLGDPSILRVPRSMPRRSFHYLSMYLGPKAARHVAFECPFILTKKAGQMRKTLPALLNIFGSKSRLTEVAMKYPSLMHVPTGNFYQGMANMIAVCGSPEAALAVGKEAMEKVARTPLKSQVPECYPTLVAIFGGLEEAHKAIDREPLLLIRLGEQFLGKLVRLRQLLGKEGAQNAVRKAPYFLLSEDQRKSFKFQHAFAAMERLFGKEETRKILWDRPELLSLGICLERALRFAERKMGSREAVRDNFDDVLRRTGLAEHLQWETKPRPRHGYWSPKTQHRKGFPRNSCSWSPVKNPTGASGPARGRWDEDGDEEDIFEDEDAMADEAFVEAELV